MSSKVAVVPHRCHAGLVFSLGASVPHSSPRCLVGKAQEPRPSAPVGTGHSSVLWLIMVKMHNKVFNNVNLTMFIYSAKLDSQLR